MTEQVMVKTLKLMDLPVGGVFGRAVSIALAT